MHDIFILHSMKSVNGCCLSAVDPCISNQLWRYNASMMEDSLSLTKSQLPFYSWNNNSYSSVWLICHGCKIDKEFVSKMIHDIYLFLKMCLYELGLKGKWRIFVTIEVIQHAVWCWCWWMSTVSFVELIVILWRQFTKSKTNQIIIY